MAKTDTAIVLVKGRSLQMQTNQMEGTSLLRRSSRTKQSKTFRWPNCQMSRLKNKGAVTVLAWNFLISSVCSYFLAFIEPKGLEISIVALGLTLPFAGWLADIRFGRYKVIRWSMWIMWIASMLTTINSVVEQFVPGHHDTFTLISQILIFLLAFGFGGYQANIIQFGLDQLQDASTSEITAFITWYVGTYICNGALFNFTNICLKSKYFIFGRLAVCTSVTIVIISSQFLERFLIKEPVTQNPIVLIYKVVRYAIKHKHPQYRSAFTYCEDELPSRIDFGKSKYGGPFTTEQVEDVKTFLRSLIVISIASVLTGEIVIMYILFYQRISDKFQQTVSTLPFKKCYTESLSTIVFNYAPSVALLFLYELTIYPCLRRCFASVKIYHKLLVGVILEMLQIITLVAYDIKARKMYIDLRGQNATIPCFYPSLLTKNSYKYWLAVPYSFATIGMTTIYISSIEFLASQTPYSMRGLMIGAGYGSVFIFTMIGYGIYWPLTHQSATWATGIISCEFWYLLSVLLVLIIFSGLLLAVGRWYKNRKREDVLPNEHIFAERYYSQIN